MALAVDVAKANQPPLASFRYAPASPGPGVEVTFTSTSSDPDGRIQNYEWDLDGDGVFGETGEPHGPTATGAARSFPAPGSYPVSLKVTDDKSASAVASQTVTVVGEQPAGGQVRRLPQSFVSEKLHGPYSLGARGLRSLAGKGPHRPSREVPEQESDPFAEQGPACPASTCVQPVYTGLAGLVFPPAPKPFQCCLAGVASSRIDPQIAAGNSYLVIGLHHQVLFYDKAGQQLYTKAAPVQKTGTAHAAAPQKSQPYTVQLCDLFKPLIPHMNAAMHLPPNLKDVDGNALTVTNGYGINCAKATGGTKPAKWTFTDSRTIDNFYWPYHEFYDARVLWDEYHKRYWIAALAKNSNAQVRGELEPDGQATLDTARARRAMVAIAVSKTEDPRDGWDEYWTWTYPGQDACPNSNECPYYGREDFMRAGITSQYLVLQVNVSDANKKGVADVDTQPNLISGENRTELIVVPTAPATPKLGQLSAYSNDKQLTNPDGSNFSGPLWPAVQHEPDVSGGKVFLASQYAPGGSDHSVLLWVLTPSATGVEAYQLAVPVNAFVSTAPGAVPQPSGAATKIFGSGIHHSLAYRNGSLYLAFTECGVWYFGCVQSALRFVRIQVKGFVTDSQGVVTQMFVDKKVDRTFTGPAAGDPPGSLAWYGFAGVDANKNGDAVIAYERSGTFVYPESRYSAYFLKESDVRTSRLLMAGDSSFGAGAGNHHYMGMSVDPWDKTGIWIINGFASAGDWGYVVGKALAPGHPDLALDQAIAQLGKPDGSYKLQLRLHNQGDSGAGASLARVYLVAKAGNASTSARTSQRAVLLRSVRVRRLARGRFKTVLLTVRVPARLRRYRYLKVSLDARHRVREYAERNNIALIRLPKRR
jgi:PKD repeat protein